MRGAGRVGTAAAVLAIALVASSCEEDFGVELPTPAVIEAATGDGQEAQVGSGLPTPVVARVAASDGRPVAGVPVSWTVTSGGGTLSTTSSVTGGGGVAQTTWTLGTTAGVQTIRASTPQVNGGADFSATALPGPPMTLSVSPPTVQFNALGQTEAISVSGEDTHGNVITGGGSWSSTNGTVATVTDAGVITAEGNGGATVNVTLGTITRGVSVNVQQDVAGLSLSSNAETLTDAGSTVTLSASMVDPNGFAVEGATVTWTSRAPSVATVSNGLVTAQGAGQTWIVAGSGGQADSASVTVEVTATAVDAITVAPATVTFDFLGDTQVLAAEARDASGAIISDASFTWSSTATSVVTVSANGVATAQGNGTATITASSGGVTSNAVSVTVEQATATLTVAPHVEVLLPGASATLSVQARDAGGSLIADPVLTSASRDGVVATVAGSVVTGGSEGVTDVVITSNGVMDSARVAVVDQNGFALLATTGPAEALVDAAPGSTLELFLWLRRPAGGTGGLGSISGTLTWDPAVLQYQSSTGEATGFSWTANEAEAAAGELGFGSFAAQGISDSFVLARVTFTVVGAQGSASGLSLAVSAAGNADGSVNIADLIQTVDGQVEVTP